MVGSDKVKNMFKKKFPSLSSLGSDGNTSFLRAARAGHLDKVLEQLRNNVDINTSNANGLNALHLASKDGHVHVVTELLKRGANVDSATKKGNTALHIASLAGQEEVVRLLVEHGASVNVQSQNGFTPLYMAAQENHDNVVKYLLANGANQSLATEDGFTPLAVAMQQGHDKVVAVLLENDTRGKVRLPALHIAAKKDDCKAAALLLQNEHNPDVTSKSGFTPLHIASHYGNEGIANLLLNKGADVNYSAKHNITPLHVAAKWGKSNMVSLLLEKGANIESKTRDGLTPLHCAARSGHEQVVDMLLERGAPISCKTKNGLAPLHMSSQGDHVDAARILLYHRAPVDEVTVDYLTALHVAAHCGHARVAKLLLDRKADPNARALNGFTPLHIACKKNRIKVVELLLKHGASIEATTESGLTPLHVASFMGCMNIVIYLLQNEANPDVPTVRGETPLHLAARANQTDIIRILLRNGAQVDARAREQQTPLHIAARLGNVDIVMLLLQHGAAVDCTTKDLYSALHIAAKEGQDEVAAVLLENGASPTATTKKGFTPLHLAAKYGNMKVARLLLQRDAPVDAQGKNGVTPLHVASHYDHQNVALLLLDRGASPHATAKNGHTPLHIAAKKNQMDIATTLLEYGAKANAESKAGFTPLHLSSQEGHIDMSSLLIDHQADTNHKAKNGLTPLHLCAQEDRVNVASVLVKNGAEIDTTTKAGYTPLHVACHFGQLNMVRFLLDEGSKVSTSTAVGYTPLHQAAQQGHCAIVNTLLEHGAPPNATTNQGQTAMSIAQKLGYISVVETLKGVTEPTTITPSGTDEKYKVVSPETMQETFMSDSEDEGGEDTLLSEQPYRYLTVDEMKSLGDDSLPIDVRQDERIDSNRECMTIPPTAVDDTISPQHLKESYAQFTTPDNIDISKHPLHVGFLVSFLVDARGGAMRGCRHSGVRVIVPPRRASMPMRVTCRYLKRDKLSHPPPLMEGEALASRILELGPVGAKFLGPVMIEVPHFGSLRGKEREIVILRSDNGETWREHTVDCSEEAVQDVLSHSFDKEDLAQLDENARTTRILTTDFPHYFAVVTRVRQEVHAIGPEGGMVSSSVVPQVQAVFPQGALTKKIKVGLQAQPIAAELAAKLLGNRVAVSPIVTVEPRRRKFHKPITLTIPKPQAANKGMINQYSGDAPTLRLLCSITGGTTRAQWEDVTGSTPFTFVNDCVSFTTTVSARFWLMDCRNVGDATKMATELYREAIHVPFMAKFVVFAKRVDPLEARLRIFCMTDDKEDKTLEHQEHFTEVAKSRDVEVLEGKTQYVEFAGNLVPVTKSGEQLQLGFRAFRENRLPFTVRVKDPHADCVGRTLFMREARLPKGEPPQQPICVLNIVLPEEIIPEAIQPEHELHKYSFIQDSSGLESYKRVDLRLSDISNLLGSDWVRLADELGVAPSDINRLKTEHPHSVAQQGLAMLRLWVSQAGNKAQASTLETALSQLGRDDIVQQCVFNVDPSGLQLLKDESLDASIRRSIPYSDKDYMKDSESVEDLSRTSLRKTGDIVEKDDKEERKYEAEEKEVEEIRKSVSERRKEIEKRLSLETPLEKRIDMVSEKTLEKGEDLSEKEIAEEKRISSPEEEPSELSFEQKRLSFEQGNKIIEMKPDKTTMKEVKERADERFLAEERRAAEALQEKKSTVDESSISFQEKRKSFEQGLKDEKLKEKKEDLRKDSALFEGVSQGLVRLDVAFTAAPQVQDLLSPKTVSKTPPPSPAEFKDITGTAAWTDEPTPDVPVKTNQLQDWAEKGKPDSTIELSNKGTSRKSMKENIETQQEDKTSNSTCDKSPQNDSESVHLKTQEPFDKTVEKESKYHFTMSVPDKKSFAENLHSITTFLESEKNYNSQTIKIDPNRLTAIADTEVTSSDETEESQSKNDSDPRSDKSFMGKMSKKIFGVFKKDDKEKSERKKGRKKKHNKIKDYDKPLYEEGKDITNVESIDLIGESVKQVNIGEGEASTGTKKVVDKIKEISDTKEVTSEVVGLELGKTVTYEVDITGIGNDLQRIEENQNQMHDYVNDAAGKAKEGTIIDISEDNQVEDITSKTKTDITECAENKDEKGGTNTMKYEISDKLKSIKIGLADFVQSESEYSKIGNDKVISSSDTTDVVNVDLSVKEVEKLHPDKLKLASIESIMETKDKNMSQTVNFVGAEINTVENNTGKRCEVSKQINDYSKETEDKRIAGRTGHTVEDVKKKTPKGLGVTFVVDDAPSDLELKSISFSKEDGNAEKLVTGEQSRSGNMPKLGTKGSVSFVMPEEESKDRSPENIAEERKATATDVSVSPIEFVKGTKEKTKSFFGGLFGKSGETIKAKKGEDAEGNEKNNYGGQDGLNNISLNFDQAESKMLIDKTVEVAKAMEKLEPSNENIEENVYSSKVSKHGKEKTGQIIDVPENTTDKVSNVVEKEKIKTTSTSKTVSDKVKGSKEKGKSLFSGLFSKAEVVSDSGKSKMANVCPDNSGIIDAGKVISISEDWNIKTDSVKSKTIDTVEMDNETNKIIPMEIVNNKGKEMNEKTLKTADLAFSVVEESITKPTSETVTTTSHCEDQLNYEPGKSIKKVVVEKTEETKSLFESIFQKDKDETDDEKSLVVGTDKNESAKEVKYHNVAGAQLVDKFTGDTKHKSKLDISNAAKDTVNKIAEIMNSTILVSNTDSAKHTKLEDTTSLTEDINRTTDLSNLDKCEFDKSQIIQSQKLFETEKDAAQNAQSSFANTLNKSITEDINVLDVSEQSHKSSVHQPLYETDLTVKTNDKVPFIGKDNNSLLNSTSKVYETMKEGEQSSLVEILNKTAEELGNDGQIKADHTIMRDSKTIKGNLKEAFIPAESLGTSEDKIRFEKNKNIDATKMYASTSEKTGLLDTSIGHKAEKLLDEGKCEVDKALKVEWETIAATGNLSNMSDEKVCETKPHTEPVEETNKNGALLNSNVIDKTDECNVDKTKLIDGLALPVLQEVSDRVQTSPNYFQSQITNLITTVSSSTPCEAHILTKDIKVEVTDSTKALSDASSHVLQKTSSSLSNTVSNLKESLDDGKVCEPVVAEIMSEKNVLFDDININVSKTGSNIMSKMITKSVKFTDEQSLNNVEENTDGIKANIVKSDSNKETLLEANDKVVSEVSIVQEFIHEKVCDVVDSTSKAVGDIFKDKKDPTKLVGDDKQQSPETLVDETLKTPEKAFADEQFETFEDLGSQSQFKSNRVSSESKESGEVEKGQIKPVTNIFPDSVNVVREKTLNQPEDGTEQNKEIRKEKSRDIDALKVLGEISPQTTDKAASSLQEISKKAEALLSDVTNVVKISENITDEQKINHDKMTEGTNDNTSRNKCPDKVEIQTDKDSAQRLSETLFQYPSEISRQEFSAKETRQEAIDGSKSNDDKLNNILIDMLIEQECMKSPTSDVSGLQKLNSDQPTTEFSSLPDKHNIEIPEKEHRKTDYSSGFKAASSFGTIESLINEVVNTSEKDEAREQPCYVTTPTMQRRKIGGSQRLSREERPALREISHIIDCSSSEEDEANYYIVTEPCDQLPRRKIVFQVESEDESSVKVSESSSEPELEVTEIIPDPEIDLKKQGSVPVEESTNYFDERAKSKTVPDKNIQKVERRFERMASETLEADPAAKIIADREFQRMVSQLSNEEVDACLSQWDEGGLTPSEELDSTKDTVEGDLDFDVEALPEASVSSTNPFYSMSSQWIDFEHDNNDVPSSIFWAFDTLPTNVVIQPNQLDIPVKSVPDKGNPFTDNLLPNLNSLNSLKKTPESPLCINTLGQSYSSSIRLPCALMDSPLGAFQLEFGGESAGEETSKSPAPPSTRESEEALLDLAAGLQDAKGSGSSSGPSDAK